MDTARPQQDDIEAYRRNATVVALLVALLLLTPLALYNALAGHRLLGVGALTVVGVIGGVTWQVRHGRNHRPLLIVLMISAMVFVAMSVYRQGIVGILWCYPLIVGNYFLLDARTGQQYNVVVLLVAIPLGFTFFEPGLALRIAATLIAVSILSAVSIRVVADQARMLRALAVTDPLTGVYNRMLLQDTLEQAIGHFARNQLPTSLVAIDIDHFKQINDTRGHDAGDVVLRHVAGLLRQRVRRADKLFRLGGEEFLVVLTGSGQTSALAVAEALRTAIENLRPLPDLVVTASAGVATITTDDDWQGLMKRADENLYRAKTAGRNCVIG